MTITINRAPVMTLWAAIVARALGHDEETALSLGKVVAGLNAQAKGRTLGIYEAPAAGDGAPRSGLGEDLWVPLLGRSVPAKRTAQGVRAVVKDKAVDPAKVRSYLSSKFGDGLAEARAAMEALASAFPPQELAENALALYQQFRPSIPKGRAGWGADGELDLEVVRGLARR